jgi:hypothetical protein
MILMKDGQIIDNLKVKDRRIINSHNKKWTLMIY